MSNLRSINRKIKSVHLVNFQNHLDTKVILDNGLNLLVGTSDCGKTAIARAISYVINNDLDGNDFVHHGKRQTEIEIEFVDGAVIRRTKGKDINRLEYKYANSDDWILKSAFGTSYPDDVVDFLGNPPSFDKLDSIAYSDQNNKNFLIDISPSSLPEVISKIIDIDDLENAAKLLQSKVKHLDKDIKTLTQSITDDKEKLELNYSGLDEKQKIVKKIEKIFAYIDKLNNYKTRLEAMNYKFSRINTKGKEYNNLIKNASKIIETLTPYADDIEKLIDDFNEKSNLNNKLINVKNNISIKQNAIDKYNKILSDKTDTLIEEITTYLEKFKSVCILTDNININSEKRASKSRDIRSQTDQIKRCQNELDDIWSAVKEMGLVCDSCNSFGGVTL